MKKILLLAIGGLFMFGSCNTTEKNSSPEALYKNSKAEQTAYASYENALSLWKAEWQEEWIDTPYGKTHAIASGPEDGQALFLLPGLFADATMWYPNAERLSSVYRIIALDMINYGGKSIPEKRKVLDISDYVIWFESICKHYGYDTVAVAGLSYSSWLCLALAREIPERIGAAVLLDPSQTFIKMDGGIAWRGIWYFGIFPNRQKYAKFCEWMGGGYHDPEMDIWFEHMLDIIEYGSVGMFDIPQHRIYTHDELTTVNMPVLVMAGGKPILYKDPVAFKKAAEAALPHAEVEIVAGAGHGINMEKPEIVNQRIMDFLAENFI